MVELSKKILVNVSFDRNLFHKELTKAVNSIKESSELQYFREWCMIEFGHVYPSILNKVFAN